jgi:hypothetical protein
MENKERFDDRHEELNKEHQKVDRNSLEDDSLEGRDQPIDLDGDGMIGNTGGFYGGTSYVGSNYGADWNANDNSQHEGNYGAAGQKDDSDRTDERLRRESDEQRERTERGE